MNEHYYIACDLGADSGRVILGHLKDGRVTLEDIHRFPNGAVKIHDSLRWNILRIFSELKIGLQKVAERKIPAESLSVDSWGVDYVLFNNRQPMLGLPYQYRDSRTDATYETARKTVSEEKIFAESRKQDQNFWDRFYKR